MNKEEIVRIIVKNIYEVIPELEGTNIKATDSMVHLGANSIDRAEIIMMTMEDLGLNIPKVELAGARNIGECAEVFYEKLQG